MYRPDPEAIQEVAASLRQSLSQSVEYLVPWFYASMPDYYFASTSREDRVEHLNAILFNRILDEGQTATLTSPDGNRLTYIASAAKAHVLTTLCKGPGDREIHSAEITTSTDRRIVIATFHYETDGASAEDDPMLAKRLPGILKEDRTVSEKDVRAFLRRCADSYLTRSTDERVLRHYRTLREFADLSCCRAMLVGFDNTAYAESTRLQIACRAGRRAEILYRLSRLLDSLGVKVLRGYLDAFDSEGALPAVIMSLYIAGPDGRQIPLNGPLRTRIERSVRALAWAPAGTDALLDRNFLLDEAGFLGAAAEFVHQMLGKRNRYAYSRANCLAAVLKHEKSARALYDAFRARFDPATPVSKRSTGFTRARAAAVALLDDIADPLERDVFDQAIAFVDGILKTNFFVPDKGGLSFRMDPASLDKRHYPEAPFGYFFFYGLQYKGFHVRFRDMARGGVRLVLSRNAEHHALESARLFDEAYNLATAQQLKNKDIPEGGSKAVILVECGADRDAAVHGAIDSLLDCILVRPDGKPLLPEIVDRYGREEIIYLGPDENVTPALIEWIAGRALARGYRYAGAFMSSKPGAGINHKEFGVTSEGVVVYLERVLETLGINPAQQPFSIKITGGPDGDVAGNAMRIMISRYGKNARIVAVSDGSGSAYDPNGLDHGAIMDLFTAAKPIAHFPAARLSKGKGAFVLDAQGKNSRIRDDLHNTVTADIFLPAGGRPNTMNDGNWQRFLKEDGTPSARAIVEGANIFLTADARKHLEAAGVLIIKDSSANKCGVICSSYEVLANLIMSTDEFLAMKKRFVPDVLEILRDRARCEADLLLSEWNRSNRTRSLIDLSMAVSREINLVTDRVMAFLSGTKGDFWKNPQYRRVILEYLPPCVAERYAARVPKQVPAAHIAALLAARIASRIVYQEGLGWLDDSLMARLPELIAAYLQEEETARACIAAVRSSKLPHRDAIVAVLEGSARRTLVRRKLRLA